MPKTPRLAVGDVVSAAGSLETNDGFRNSITAGCASKTKGGTGKVTADFLSAESGMEVVAMYETGARADFFQNSERIFSSAGKLSENAQRTADSQ